MTSVTQRSRAVAFQFPIHVAVHWLGCAVQTPGGIAMRGAVGPHIECLADYVDRVTVVAHDPPSDPRSYEDLVEYVAKPKRDNIDICSLGPKGTIRDYIQRRLRIARIVRKASKEWDLVLFRMPNRRVELMHNPNQCHRTVAMIGGDPIQVLRATPMAKLKKLLTLAAAYYADHQFKRVVRDSGVLFVNNEVLLDKYNQIFPNVILQRSSARRSRFTYETHDRMQSGKVKFFYAGKLTPEKGVFEVLKAFALIRKELLPEAELHYAGTGNAVAELKEMANNLGVAEEVTFHGWVSVGTPLFDLLREMDVFLFLSYAEGFPKVVWEAMAHSVPVISTPVGSLDRVFSDEQELLFVPVRGIHPVVDAVRRLQRDQGLRRRLICTGYARAQESSLENVVEDLLGHVAQQWPELTMPKYKQIGTDMEKLRR